MLGIYVRTSREDGGKEESPIEQQKRAGIQFAEANKMPYVIYEDKGISGFKISDDDEDPFKNRPRFTDLIEDIKSKKVDAIWVWEHSRLSRNQYASAIIFNLFEKNNIKVFEKDKEFNLKDPQAKMFRGILDVMAEYERSLIVGRITRGVHNRINQGRRLYGQLYGYKKIGLDSNGRGIIEKVDSEIENIKYAYKRMIEGATLRQITLELYNNKSDDKIEMQRHSGFLRSLLRHFSYTGFELNIEGIEILRKFDNYEIDSLSKLNNENYYIKSQNYPIKIVSIIDWIKVVERIRIKLHKKKNRKASKDLITGIITCNKCGQKYYTYMRRYFNDTSNGICRFYRYYSHHASPDKHFKCDQIKSYMSVNIDEIFRTFYFFHFIAFDNTTELLKESQRKIKSNQLKLQEQIKNLEKNNNQYERIIKKFNNALDETDNVNEIKILAKRISDTEGNIKINSEKLSISKIELEKFNELYSNNEITNAFYNIADKINHFFNNKNIEEQRDELLLNIKNCIVSDNYLLIDTGIVIYLFDTYIKYKFDNSLLENLNKDEIYKKYFTEYKEKDSFINYPLVNDKNKEKEITFPIKNQNLKNVKMMNLQKAQKYLSEILKIDYDISSHSNIIYFF